MAEGPIITTGPVILSATLAATVDTGVSRVSSGIVGVGNGTTGDISGTLKAASLYSGAAAFMLHTSTTITTTGTGTKLGTLTTVPTSGDPTKWIPYDDNGTTRYIPAW